MKRLLVSFVCFLMLTFGFRSYATESLRNLEIEFFYPSRVSETKDISINLYTPHCFVESKSYEFNSSQLTVYILPEEGYRFSTISIKEAEIYGAKYITAAVDRENGAIKLTVELSPDGGMEESGLEQEKGKWIYREDSGRWMYRDGDGELKTGWFFDDSDSAWYYLDSYGFMLKNLWIESNGNQYYLSESGKMLTDTVTPDGMYVGADGASTGYTLNHTTNVKEDSLSFLQGKSLITIPCKIHYRGGKIGEYTTLRYDSVGMQEFNGIAPNLIITYTVLRSGRYESTNIGLDILVNGKKRYTLGGKEGDILVHFDRNSVEVGIPYDSLTQNDIVDIYINR